MFGLGLFELVVIGVVALIFIKPDDLPKVIRKGRQLFQQFTDAYKNVEYEYQKLESTITDITRDPRSRKTPQKPNK